MCNGQNETLNRDNLKFTEFASDKYYNVSLPIVAFPTLSTTPNFQFKKGQRRSLE